MKSTLTVPTGEEEGNWLCSSLSESIRVPVKYCDYYWSSPKDLDWDTVVYTLGTPC